MDLLEETATKTRLRPGNRHHVYLFSFPAVPPLGGPFPLAGIWNHRIRVSFIIANAKCVNWNSGLRDVISRCPGTVPVLGRKLPNYQVPSKVPGCVLAPPTSDSADI